MAYTTERRKKLDHNRYMANREERCAKQRKYYQENKEKILLWHRNNRLKNIINN